MTINRFSKLFQPRLKWCIFIGLLVVSLVTSLTIARVYARPLTLEEYYARLDSSIYNIRTGDVIIKLVNSQQKPVVGAEIKLEQTKHNFEFGTALASSMFAPEVNPQDQATYLQKVKELFNYTVHENAFKWEYTEPQQNQYNFQDVDRIFDWSINNEMPIRGHAVYWTKEQFNPPWLKTLSPEQLRQAVYKRAYDICGRYAGILDEYDVVNEMTHGDFFQYRLGEGILKDMFDWCKQADPTATLYVNDYNLVNGKSLNLYVEKIRALINSGAPVGGIGIQVHVREYISPGQIQHTLDTLAQFGLPLKITEFTAVWESEQEKARVQSDLYRIAFAHPAVKGIYMWGFWAGAHWDSNAALYSYDWQPLPAGNTYQDMVFKSWWTRVNTFTNNNGELQARAFFGDYLVTVQTPNGITRRTFSFPPGQPGPKVVTITVS